ncbi:SCO family protein [Halorubrum sp. JWXQ-INN 858]|uniref:SCO family protein n=1 Tax=Halorubrum sp. JWXQ-INN 858 TaxID=2690782 RepID=UPI00135C14B8|nr:SCO family protein [Halorubrum sp. JWXQ-INN 858]MWV65423.1 SCO family protein [Halorubrum sp. JWXQ-INN 858]
MKRRALLGGVGTVAAGSIAGCVTRLFDDEPDGVVLDPQEDQIADSEDLSYPAYGQRLPEFELHDPVSDVTIDSASLDRTAIVTAIFTFCPAECGILLNQLVGVQGILAEAGMTDEVAFLPITFDPERDDADAFRENADTVGADLDAGNWHYLRPESAADARAVVDDGLGIGFERTTDSDRVEGYDFIHAVVTLLANPDGVVERAYRGENLDRNRVAADAEAVVEAFRDR